MTNPYALHEHHDFLPAAQQALADPGLQTALTRLTGTLTEGNRRGYATLADADQLRDHAKQVKEHTLAHLDRYLEQLEASVRRQGEILDRLIAGRMGPPPHTVLDCACGIGTQAIGR